MSPKELHAKVTEDHAELRARLTRVEELAHSVCAGQPAHSDLAREAAGLAGFLFGHMKLEEGSTEILLDTDAYGEERVRQMNQHHETQSADLCELLERVRRSDADPRPLAELVLHLVKETREDMKWEEENLFSAELLRDDVVGVGVFTG